MPGCWLVCGWTTAGAYFLKYIFQCSILRISGELYGHGLHDMESKAWTRSNLNGDFDIFSRRIITEQIPSPISSHDQVPQSAPSQTFFPAKISSSQSTLILLIKRTLI